MLTVNPNTRILHRRGGFFAVELSRRTPLVQVTELDLVVLAAFFGGKSVTAVREELMSGGLHEHLARPVPEHVIASRIADMERAQVLVSADLGHAGLDVSEALTLAGAAIVDSTGDDALRLGKNFALLPAADGFAIWSATELKHVLLDLKMTRLICRFAEGSRPSELMHGQPGLGEGRGIANAARVLAKKGLLARVMTGAVQSVGREREVKRQSLGSRAVLWQELPAAGRIPVYFVPHMENHFPLALGMMYSAIEAHAGGVLLERFQLLPITYLSMNEIVEGPYRRFGPGIWLFSNYMWSVEYNLKFSQSIKSLDGANVCIHGGPSTPGYEEACTSFMRANPSVDIAVHGEGELSLVELLQCVSRSGDEEIRVDTQALRDVAGLTYRDPLSSELVWTMPRTRMREPDVIPSPYLTGAFDAYQGRVEAAIIESNRGCPFGCTFCDWGSAILQKVRKFDLERVREEIEWIGRNEIRVLWIADANFGMYDRDIEISKMIVDAKSRLGYPREVVVNYAKNTNRRLVEIIRILSEGGIISQGIISIQTTDEITLEVINRRNIKTEKYDELIRVFADAQLPLSTDLMIGLPGITVDAWNRDLQRYFDIDVTVKAYRTRLLPNSPMADPEYMRKYRIEVDDNGFIAACHSFTPQQLNVMRRIFLLFAIADGYGVLRYVLRYLQWDHGIEAIVFLHKVLDKLRWESERFPLLSWVASSFIAEKSVPGGWHGFYRELAGFIEREFAIEEESALSVAFAVNELAMPDDTRSYPMTIELGHDFVAYFLDRKTGMGKGRRLTDYAPGSFTVVDPNSMAHIDLDFLQYDSHQYFWELHSAISRPKSIADTRDGFDDAA